MNPRSPEYQGNVENFKTWTLFALLGVAVMTSIILLIVGSFWGINTLKKATSENSVTTRRNQAEQEYFLLCKKRFRLGVIDPQCLAVIARSHEKGGE